MSSSSWKRKIGIGLGEKINCVWKTLCIDVILLEGIYFIFWGLTFFCFS